MKGDVAAARKYESTRRRQHTGRAGAAEHFRQRHVLQRGMAPHGARHWSAPRFRSRATRWPYGGFSSGRPFMNSAFVSPARTSSASPSDARGFEGERSDGPTRMRSAWLVVFKYSTPVFAS